MDDDTNNSKQLSIHVADNDNVQHLRFKDSANSIDAQEMERRILLSTNVHATNGVEPSTLTSASVDAAVMDEGGNDDETSPEATPHQPPTPEAQVVAVSTAPASSSSVIKDVASGSGVIMVEASPVFPNPEAELLARIAQLEDQNMRQGSTGTRPEEQAESQLSADPGGPPKTPTTTNRECWSPASRWKWALIGLLVTITVVLVGVLVPLLSRKKILSTEETVALIQSVTLVSNTTHRYPLSSSSSGTTMEERALAWLVEQRELNGDAGRVTQRYALATLFLSASSLPDSTSWPKDECDWPGVSCEEESVTVLHLESTGLSGTMPPDVGLLTRLTSLQFDDNALTGTLPNSIGLLTDLSLLYLFDNKLQGPIPDSLQNLSVLSQLRCGNNFFNGTFPDFLGPSLEWISFHMNKLSGPLPNDAMGQLKSLQALALSMNNLTGTIPSQVWTDLPNLGHLVMNENALVGTLPAVYNNPKLERLELRGNRLTGTLPEWTALVNDLDLTNNNFTGSTRY